MVAYLNSDSNSKMNEAGVKEETCPRPVKLEQEVKAPCCLYHYSEKSVAIIIF